MGKLGEYHGHVLSAEQLQGILPAEFSPQQLRGLGDLMGGSQLSTLGGGLEGLPVTLYQRLDAAVKTEQAPYTSLFRQPRVTITATTKPAPQLPPKPATPQVQVEVPARAINPNSVLAIQRQAQPAVAQTSVADQVALNRQIRQETALVQDQAIVKQQQLKLVQGKQAIDKLSWLQKSLLTANVPTATVINPRETVKINTTLPAAITKKAKEIANGGLLGGVIAAKGQAITANLIKNAAAAVDLKQQAQTAPTASAIMLESQSNRLMATVLTDRARLERLRSASVLGLYGIIKREEQRQALGKAGVSSDGEKVRHLNNAIDQGQLADQAQAESERLLITSLEVPGLADEVAQLNQPVTAGAVLHNRSTQKAPDQVRFRGFHAPQVMQSVVRIPDAGTTRKLPQFRDPQSRSSSRIATIMAAAGSGRFDGLGGDWSTYVDTGMDAASTTWDIAKDVKNGDYAKAMGKTATAAGQATDSDILKVGGKVVTAYANQTSGSSKTPNVGVGNPANVGKPNSSAWSWWPPFAQFSTDGRDRKTSRHQDEEYLYQTARKAFLVLNNAENFKPEQVEQAKLDLINLRRQGEQLSGQPTVAIKWPAGIGAPGQVTLDTGRYYGQDAEARLNKASFDRDSLPPPPPPPPPPPAADASSFLGDYWPWLVGGGTLIAGLVGTAVVLKHRSGLQELADIEEIDSLDDQPDPSCGCRG